MTRISQRSAWQDIFTIMMKEQKVLVVVSVIPLSKQSDSSDVAFEQLVLILPNFSLEE